MDDKDDKKNVTPQVEKSGKNKKKKKEIIDINNFIDSSPAGFSTAKINWADCIDEDDEFDNIPSKKQDVIILPNAPKSARGPDFNVDDVPHNAPFIAYMRNMPNEVNEDEVCRFFKELEVKDVQLERGGMHNSVFGATVEFYDRETLIQALCRSNENMRNREVRITFTDPRTDRRPYGSGRDYGRDRYGDRGSYSNRDRGYSSRVEESTEPDRTEGDWRGGEKPSLPPPRSGRRDDYYSGRNSGGRFNDYDRSRRDDGAHGSASFSEPQKSYQRLQLQKPTKQPDPNAEFQAAPLTAQLPPPSQQPGEAAEAASMAAPIEPPQPTAEPKERKKLVLQPRTKPIEPAAAPPVADAPSRASIFGDAKPVDTTKKLEEFERKQKEHAATKTVSSPPQSVGQPEPIEKAPARKVIVPPPTRSIDRPPRVIERPEGSRRNSDSESLASSQSGRPERRFDGESYGRSYARNAPSYRNDYRSDYRNDNYRGDRGYDNSHYVQKPPRIIQRQPNGHREIRRPENVQYEHSTFEEVGENYATAQLGRERKLDNGIQNTNRFQNLSEAYID